MNFKLETAIYACTLFINNMLRMTAHQTMGQ